MVNCSVYGCHEKSVMDIIKLFRFPKDEETRKIWEHRCSREDKLNLKNARICSKHFSAKQYYHIIYGSCILKKNSVPDLNLPKGKFSRIYFEAEPDCSAGWGIASDASWKEVFKKVLSFGGKSGPSQKFTGPKTLLINNEPIETPNEETEASIRLSRIKAALITKSLKYDISNNYRTSDTGSFCISSTHCSFSENSPVKEKLKDHTYSLSIANPCNSLQNSSQLLSERVKEEVNIQEEPLESQENDGVNHGLRLDEVSIKEEMSLYDSPSMMLEEICLPSSNLSNSLPISNTLPTSTTSSDLDKPSPDSSLHFKSEPCSPIYSPLTSNSIKCTSPVAFTSVASSNISSDIFIPQKQNK